MLDAPHLSTVSAAGWGILTCNPSTLRYTASMPGKLFFALLAALLVTISFVPLPQ
jgi:hypothetical protein